MGKRRFRHRNKTDRKRGKPTATESTATESTANDNEQPFPTWSASDRQDLLLYLHAYRQRAMDVYYQSTSKKRKSFFTGQIASKDDAQQRQLLDGTLLSPPNSIGGHEFPDLGDPSIPRKPYLTLPITLTSKQRKQVHECCLFVDLYHTSVGPTRDNRTAIISIYADGLSRVPGLEQPVALRLDRYRPWLCRRQHHVETASTTTATDQTNGAATALRAIEALIDQPGTCLRDDGTDELWVHSSNEEASSLADVPTPGETDPSAWTLIDTKEKVLTCVQHLVDESPSELAFDLECYNPSKEAQMTCLIQLATRSHQYVVDPLAEGVWEALPILKVVFENPAICKIGHATGGLDIKCLYRDFGISVVNLFDTYEAAKVLNGKNSDTLGLAALCRQFGLSLEAWQLYVELKQVYQSTDWRVRPLTDPMIQYGRFDVAYLIPLRRLLMRDLLEGIDRTSTHRDAVASSISLQSMLRDMERAEGDTELPTPSQEMAEAEHDGGGGDDDDDTKMKDDHAVAATANNEKARVIVYTVADLRLQPRLMRVLSLSQERCRSRGGIKTENPLANKTFATLRLEADWTQSSTNLYFQLVQWRQDLAAELECLAPFVAPLDLLAAVAYKRPTREACLRRLSYFLPALLEDEDLYRKQLLDLVKMHVAMEQKEGEPITEEKFDETPLYATLEEAGTLQATGMNTGMSVAWKVALAATVGASASLLFHHYYARSRRR